MVFTTAKNKKKERIFAFYRAWIVGIWKESKNKEKKNIVLRLC